MYVLIFVISLLIGNILNYIIKKISYSINKDEINAKTEKFLVLAICCVSFEMLFLRYGFNVLLAKTVTLTAILIIISAVDIKHRIIPDFMVWITLSIGIVFSLIIKTPFADTLLGMVCGGGILFLLALIPGALGGGDVKIMFAIGSFLGFNRTLRALILAFIFSSIISIALIVTKIKNTKDYIPFGPFLSLGSFISLLMLL